MIAILAAYAALDVAGRVTSAEGRLRLVWLTGGSLAMGIGIWSMHYIGMRAIGGNCLVEYGSAGIFLSSGIAILSPERPLAPGSRVK